MGTHAYIGIENPDQTITFSYCHFDGYYSHTAPLLLQVYNTEEKIRQLLSLGDLSSLHKYLDSLNPDSTHSFNTPEEDVCIFYGRDRGETGIDALTLPYSEYLHKVSYNYSYLWKENQWWGTVNRAPFQKLTNININET